MSFALDLEAIAKKVDARTNAIVKKIVLEVGNSLVFKSPVGDKDYWVHPEQAPPGYVGGRFRGNWQYGLNSPNPLTTDGIDPGGDATISAIVGSIPEQAAGNIHYITNSLPYAKRLEEGWSHRQAPNGMVAITILEFQPTVEAVARELSQ